MSELILIAALLIIFVFASQMYFYASSGNGIERQDRCRMFGIITMAIGITSLAIRSAVTVFGGIILIMFGFRLIAKGLDRIDKKTFIDHFEEDDTPK